MTILALVKPGDPILSQAVEEFDFQNPMTDPIQLAKDLYETMVTNRGLGLAAPQVGIAVRAFAMYAVPGIVCFNPRIVAFSEQKVNMDEGCLSFPGLLIKGIKRSANIRVRYAEPNGNVVTKPLEGMSARIFQHEFDHLNGITFHKKVHPLHLARALNQQKHSLRNAKRQQHEAQGR